MKTKVYIYGLCDVFYDSYYIEGIKKIYKKYTFNTSKFPKFNQGTFAVIIEGKHFSKKIIIDSLDRNSVNDELLKWCDVYGKVNYNENNLPSIDQHKIIAIGPSFGIKIWNIYETLFYTLLNFIRFKKSIFYQREFVANYWRQYTRQSLKKYKVSESSHNEVFFMNSIWKQEEKTNANRAMFIQICKELKGVNFEGGFAARKNGDNLGFDSLVYSKTMPLKIYLNKIKNSALVFSTPAVLFCHGWKLGEFLALGKAIIMTNHYNQLPENLVDNEHVIYANNAHEIKSAIKRLKNDIEFRRKLEFNSRKYFDEYLAPDVVILKLLSRSK